MHRANRGRAFDLFRRFDNESLRDHLTATTRRNLKMNEIERIDTIAAIQAEIQTLLTKLRPITDAIESGQADARLLDKNNSLQKRIASLEDRKQQLDASS
jgi:hypothetical protein